MALAFKQQNSYSLDDLLECGHGRLFGPGNAQLPLPPMLMFDRITHISDDGGNYGKGEIVAELDVKPLQPHAMLADVAESVVRKKRVVTNSEREQSRTHLHDRVHVFVAQALAVLQHQVEQLGRPNARLVALGHILGKRSSR